MFSAVFGNEWFWLGAACLFAMVIGALVAFERFKRAALEQAMRDDQAEGWRPTGRVDFAGSSDTDAYGDFLLQAEDTRIVHSIGGLEHHEIRWRKATLKEAKTVVKTYHENLQVLSSSGPSIIPSEALSPDRKSMSVRADSGIELVEPNAAEPHKPAIKNTLAA